MFQKIGNFLFGKLPQIFNKKGEVSHHLKKSRWVKWTKRYQHDPNYDWRQHSGRCKPPK